MPTLLAQWNISAAANENSTAILRPPFSIKWSVATKENSASQVFVLSEYRYCNFEIAFHRDGPRTVESLTELAAGDTTVASRP
jgi:hypothetical protein